MNGSSGSVSALSGTWMFSNHRRAPDLPLWPHLCTYVEYPSTNSYVHFDRVQSLCRLDMPLQRSGTFSSRTRVIRMHRCLKPPFSGISRRVFVRFATTTPRLCTSILGLVWLAVLCLFPKLWPCLGSRETWRIWKIAKDYRVGISSSCPRSVILDG